MLTHLIQSHELFGPPERHEELREVWRRNEGIFDEYTYPEGRPTFTELFAMCKPGAVNIIANADIYFEANAGSFIEHETRNFDKGPIKFCFALSRWETIDGNGTQATLWDHHDSQDCWIVFGGPHKVDADFTMGMAGCDNALVHRLQLAGFYVLNPSKSIRCFHLHNVDWRSYIAGNAGQARGGAKIERVPPPYAFVQPTTL